MKAILDANLLMVLLVGLCEPGNLGRKKHVKEYARADFALLCALLKGFDELIVTPNVVTECSNLLCGRSGHGQNAPESRMLSALLDKGFLVQLEERYVASFDATIRSEYSYLGVSDCSLLHLVDADHVVVTADGSLARAAQAINRHSINFGHVKLGKLQL